MGTNQGYIRGNLREERKDVLVYALEGARALANDPKMTEFYFESIDGFLNYPGDEPPSSELLQMLKEGGIFQE